MRSIGTLVVVTGLLVLGSACGDSGGGVTPPENAAPVAIFTVPPCVIDVPCAFASASTDDAAVTGWSWDFNGDGTPDATTETASYEYKVAGDFNVSLTVHDAEGLSHTKTSPITIAPAEPPPPPPPVNQPPSAGFTYTCALAVCTFLSTSNDVDGTIASYSWSFGDDGTAAVDNPSHTYSLTARTEFTVTLTVTDNEGATDVETQLIAVDPIPPTNPPPTARFTSSCTATAVCTFVSTSFDHGGRVSAQAWTFGDGGTATEISPSHTYTVTAATEFTVTLTVTDNEGATGVASQTILIDPNATNQPPTASFTPWCYGEGCIFFSKSTDAAPGTIAHYAWVFGDGAIETDWNAPSHVYSVSGRT